MRMLFVLLVFLSGCAHQPSESQHADESVVDGTSSVIHQAQGEESPAISAFLLIDDSDAGCTSRKGCLSAMVGKLEKVWSRPPSARDGMVAVVYVEFDGAAKANVGISKSSGNSSFDFSCLRAVQDASIGSEIRKLNQITAKAKKINLKFAPDDLLY